MGYALFAQRKIFYTNLVFTLQSKLDNIKGIGEKKMMIIAAQHQQRIIQKIKQDLK